MKDMQKCYENYSHLHKFKMAVSYLLPYTISALILSDRYYGVCNTLSSKFRKVIIPDDMQMLLSNNIPRKQKHIHKFASSYEHSFHTCHTILKWLQVFLNGLIPKLHTLKKSIFCDLHIRCIRKYF